MENKNENEPSYWTRIQDYVDLTPVPEGHVANEGQRSLQEQDNRCGLVPMSELNVGPYERFTKLPNYNFRHIPKEMEDVLQVAEDARKKEEAEKKKKEAKQKQKERDALKRQRKRDGIEEPEPVERKRKEVKLLGPADFEKHPIVGAYMEYHGLSLSKWDEAKNGPLLSRMMNEKIAFMAMKYPFQYKRVSLERDPAKFIHVIVLTQKFNYMQFLIRNDRLNNSQFDELDYFSFPERMIRAPPSRFFHWIAGAEPQVDWFEENGDHVVYNIKGFPKYYPNEYDMHICPHEIGLLSNRNYDGEIIDPSIGDIRDRGIFLYICDMFLPVPQHMIQHWFIFRFPFTPMRPDPLSNRERPMPPTKKSKKEADAESESAQAADGMSDEKEAVDDDQSDQNSDS